MDLEKMRTALGALKSDYERVEHNVSRRALSADISDLKIRIAEEERRTRAVKNIRVIDGVQIEIPHHNWHESDHEKFHVHEGVLYLIERGKKIKDNGEFHWHSYAWLPDNAGKCTSLCVRMIGGDYHGNRAFAHTNHYKHPSDMWCYQSRDIRLDSPVYRPYVEHILQEVAGWTFEHLKQR
jgi:hypothetical protein